MNETHTSRFYQGGLAERDCEIVDIKEINKNADNSAYIDGDRICWKSTRSYGSDFGFEIQFFNEFMLALEKGIPIPVSTITKRFESHYQRYSGTTIEYKSVRRYVSALCALLANSPAFGTQITNGAYYGKYGYLVKHKNFWLKDKNQARLQL
jgi:hypothetical protein